MIKNRPNSHATHFRLSPESWIEILEAYRNGATAKELAARWKVAPGTIYRYVRERGFTKKYNSDAVARAHAQRIADEEAEVLARRDFARDMTRKKEVAGEDYASVLFPFIEKVAVSMLGDQSHEPAVFSRAVFRWRAATFGPELAQYDFERMRAGGWDTGIFNEDGSIIEGWDFISRRHPEFK